MIILRTLFLHRGSPHQPPLRTRVRRRICLLLAFLQLPFLWLPAAGEVPNAEAGETALNALETALVATLQEATFIGRWHPIADGEVGAERRDQYRIAGAEKIGDNRWIIRARLSAEVPDLIIPVPLRIEWAGDTPVLIVDDFGLPGMNPYSARVLIFDDTYAGTWSGGGMAGLIGGIIVREANAAKPPTDGEDPLGGKR